MKANDFVALALRSPLHAIMGDTALVTVTGRKTGRKISLPVNYYRDGDDLWVLSSRDRTWWRNLCQGAQVAVRLHGNDRSGFAEVILDEAMVRDQLGEYVRRLPAAARHIGLRIEGGVPNYDDLASIAKERLFVHICLQSG